MTILTSSGIGLLIATNENANFGRLHLLGVHDNRSVQRPLASVGLLGLFDVFPDLDTLLARVRTIELFSTGRHLQWIALTGAARS